MDSVTKTTILDFVGNWLPWECSVCRNNGSAIKFAWWTDPILCWECAEAAPQDVRQRLQRVKVARHALGFENFSLYDLEKALWPGRGRFSVIMDQRMPPCSAARSRAHFSARGKSESFTTSTDSVATSRLNSPRTRPPPSSTMPGLHGRKFGAHFPQHRQQFMDAGSGNAGR